MERTFSLQLVFVFHFLFFEEKYLPTSHKRRISGADRVGDRYDEGGRCGRCAAPTGEYILLGAHEGRGLRTRPGTPPLTPQAVPRCFAILTRRTVSISATPA